MTTFFHDYPDPDTNWEDILASLEDVLKPSDDDIPPMYEKCLKCGAIFPEWEEICPECGN